MVRGNVRLGVAASPQPSVATFKSASLILAQPTPHSGILARFQSPAQTFVNDAAVTADSLRLFNLNQCGAGVADREEQLRILVTAGRLVAPVHASQLHWGTHRRSCGARDCFHEADSSGVQSVGSPHAARRKKIDPLSNGRV